MLLVCHVGNPQYIRRRKVISEHLWSTSDVWELIIFYCYYSSPDNHEGYGIIAKGRLIEEITAEELEKKCGSRTSVKTNDPKKAMEIIKKLLNIENVEIDAKGTILIGDPVKNIGEITNELFKNDIVVEGISTSDSSAESYFIKKMEEG